MQPDMAGKAQTDPADYRAARLAVLARSQNPDGGWGYAPGKQSWLEPTCYSLLALMAQPEAAESFARGWKLVRSWQLADGGWRPTAAVKDPAWSTALCVTLHCARRTFDEPFARGVGWLAGTTGNEGSLLERFLCLVMRPPNDFDRTLKGWPWRPNSASWVEPTAHALIALKLARAHASPGAALPQTAKRIADAEAMLLDRRAADGGWNYGNKRVLETNLPAYPETTGIALLGLQGNRAFDSKAATGLALEMWRRTTSPLARAWLAIAVRNYGHELPPATGQPRENDTLLAALEALACPEGGHQWLKV